MNCPCIPQAGEFRQVLRGASRNNQYVITQRWSNARSTWVDVKAEPVR